MIERMGGNYHEETHKTSFFKKIWKDGQRKYGWGRENCIIADPFARNCTLAQYTNDLNEDTKAKFNLDAILFLKQFERHYFDLLIFDPPFSTYQGDKHYNGNNSLYTKPGYIKEIMIEIERVLKPSGQLLKFGYNTNQHKHHFELTHLWVVHHGGNINDTLVSLWTKNNHNLTEWE